eukprot:CAMPEP_0170633578 /NCGR_PEP_ID=MMETSP0224-20130122/36083_1 /TAXON_ID=285029 /ORGANISM="Togula jolla, Strain CCCM 725" /LENGTH=472 /DNA_ID=CAMNT_0010962661 /DNA_START=39 /DNA_END=1453 /DNA_ORIENTATION=-
MAPHCGNAFILAETTHTNDFESRKLPGWRPLTIDEHAQMAMKDRSVLELEEIWRGPRYQLWTLEGPQLPKFKRSGLYKLRGEDGQGQKPSKDDPAASSPQLVGGRLHGLVGSHACALMPLTSKDGRSLYAVCTGGGLVTFWDVKLKQEAGSRSVGHGVRVTTGPSRNPSQFIIAEYTYSRFGLSVFEEQSTTASVIVDATSLPWATWPRALRESLHMTPSRARAASEAGVPDGEHFTIRAIFHVEDYYAFAVMELPGSSRAPMGLLVNLQDGAVRALDVFGRGACAGVLALDDDDDEDNLISVHLIEQQFHERPGKSQQTVILMYSSAHLAALTMNDEALHVQRLREEMATERQRSDTPVQCEVLANHSGGSYHLIVSYSSSMLRWWKVTLTKCMLVANLSLTTIATHLSALHWREADETPSRRVTVAKSKAVNLNKAGSPRGSSNVSPSSTARRGSMSWQTDSSGSKGRRA